jgi:WD40 repeat protein
MSQFLTFVEHPRLESPGVAFALSPDGRLVAHAGFQAAAVEWVEVRPLDGSRPSMRLSFPMSDADPSTGANCSNGINQLAWHPDLPMLASGSWRHEAGVRVWGATALGAAAERAAATITAHRDNVTGVAFSPIGRTLFSTSACSDKAIRWCRLDLSWLGELHHHPGDQLGEVVDSVDHPTLYGYATPAVSPDGQWLAVQRLNQDGTRAVEVRRARAPAEVLCAFPSRSGVFAWSPDGAHIWTDNPFGQLVMCSPLPGTLEIVRDIPLVGPLQSLAARPDGNAVAVISGHGSSDGSDAPGGGDAVVMFIGRDSSGYSVLAESHPLGANVAASGWIADGSRLTLVLGDGRVLGVTHGSGRSG